MKLKEYPISFWNTLKLTSKPLSSFYLKKNKAPIIVSLTTIRSRLSKVHITIRSILNQDILPEKIILWINNDDVNFIPKNLLKLKSDLFEIKTTPLHCSHKKLIHTLKSFPNSNILTCDDDFIYHPTWIKLIEQEHKQYPNNIIANQTRKITFDDSGNLLAYKQWKNLNNKSELNNKLILPIGANGILYPPNTLNKIIFDEKLFLQLAPKADDLWFKAMALLNNTISIQANLTPPSPIPIAGTQSISLKKENIGLDKNKTQWLAIENYFNFNLSIINKTN